MHFNYNDLHRTEIAESAVEYDKTKEPDIFCLFFFVFTDLHGEQIFNEISAVLIRKIFPRFFFSPKDQRLLTFWVHRRRDDRVTLISADI